jgi:hypothetical protein
MHHMTVAHLREAMPQSVTPAGGTDPGTIKTVTTVHLADALQQAFAQPAPATSQGSDSAKPAAASSEKK